MKIFQTAAIALGLLALSAPLAAQQSAESKKWHQKSDTAKGVDQINAPAKGKVYANPDRQKALDDAMRSDSSSKASGDRTRKSGTASPQR